MKTIKTVLVALSGLGLLLSAPAASAQQTDWHVVATAARLAHQKGSYAEAETLYRQALELQAKTTASKRADVATTLNNLAVVFQDDYQDAAAEPLYRHSLEIWEKIPGKDANVATGLNNLAALYHDEHKDDQAAPLYTRALAIW